MELWSLLLCSRQMANFLLPWARWNYYTPLLHTVKNTCIIIYPSTRFSEWSLYFRFPSDLMFSTRINMWTFGIKTKCMFVSGCIRIYYLYFSSGLNVYITNIFISLEILLNIPMCYCTKVNCKAGTSTLNRVISEGHRSNSEKHKQAKQNFNNMTKL
jgi:hypothetical protein